MGLLDEVAEGSGLGALDADALRHLRATTNARVSTQRHPYHRGLGGSAPADQLPTLLTMLELKLTPGAQPFAPRALAECKRLQQEVKGWGLKGGWSKGGCVRGEAAEAGVESAAQARSSKARYKVTTKRSAFRFLVIIFLRHKGSKI